MDKHNLYAPPVADVAGAADGLPDSHFLYKTSGIAIATFVGGALAGGYLTHANLRQRGSAHKSRLAIAVFSVLTLGFFVIAWYTPPDFISLLISVALPQLVVVLIALRLLHGMPARSSNENALYRSNWRALGIGVLCNFAIKALFWLADALGYGPAA